MFSHVVNSLLSFSFLTKKMSHSPSPSASSESYYSYSDESEPESFPEKPLLEIGG